MPSYLYHSCVVLLMMIRACQLYCSFSWNNIMIFFLIKIETHPFRSFLVRDKSSSGYKRENRSKCGWLLLQPWRQKHWKDVNRKCFVIHLLFIWLLLSSRGIFSQSFYCLDCLKENNTVVTIYFGQFLLEKISINWSVIIWTGWTVELWKESAIYRLLFPYLSTLFNVRNNVTIQYVILCS